jgi:ribosomal protein S18 acetylase RimI-like enzyme
METGSLSIEQVNFHDEVQGLQLVELLNCYAVDPAGGGEELTPYVKENLIEELKKRSFAYAFIAYYNENGLKKPVGLALAFEGFSSFNCEGLLNIHDFVVVKEYRSKGVGTRLLQEIERFSLAKGYCKITLEVLERNITAQNLYRKLGFAGYQLSEEFGAALFWSKNL